MKVILISDTEENLTQLEEWVHFCKDKFFRSGERIVHLGDGIENIKKFLPENATIYIKGNHDKNSGGFPKKKIININGFRILFIHGDRKDKISEKFNILVNSFRKAFNLKPLLDEYYSELFTKYKSKYDLVAYGHMHIPRIDIIDNTIFFCPGSFSSKKTVLDTKPSFGVLEIKTKNNKKHLVFNVFSLLLKKRTLGVVKELTKKIIW
ncbi:MAG: metallophosphoesterase family protein [Patescibacteria group bacterium]